MLRTAALSALAAIVIAADWLRLERPRETGARVLGLVLLAIAPALVRNWRIRVVAIVVATSTAVSLAFSLSALRIWPGGHSFFGPFWSRLSGGVEDFYTYHLPVDPAQLPRMHMLLLFAAFAFTLFTALSIAAGRPELAVVSFLVGAGWPATLLAGGHGLLRGTVILAVALVLLAGASGRGGRFAVPAVGVVVLCAIGLSAAPAVAKPGFLDWQHWNPYAHSQKSVDVSFVWNGSYAGVRFPTTTTTVLTIAAPRTIGTYWRATVLDAYVGGHWVERLWRETPAERDLLEPARSSTTRVAQEVTVDGLRDRHLVGASIPTRFVLKQNVRPAGQDVSVTAAALQRGARYTALSYVPQPTARDLVALPARYPRALTKRGRELELAPGLDAPSFGAAGRDAILERRLTGRLAPYRRLLARAQAVAGRTRSPYAAVVALERWLRTTGHFAYSEQPPLEPGVPPLVGFVLDTKTGYCQHFAGAMALMARLLGIPARVAAGFVSGSYAHGRWTITDHDAHTWVEVWFPRYGWLPFDPTPGRGRLGASYTDASLRFDPAAETKLLAPVVRGGEVFGSGVEVRGGPERPEPLLRRTRGTSRGPSGSFVSTSRPSLLRFLLLLAAGTLAAIALAKLVRRRVRYLSRDPRRVARACAQELADFLADQRLVPPPGATVKDLGRSVYERLGVDVMPFADAVDGARFGPSPQAPERAERARAELRALKSRLRGRIGARDRARGFVSLRSLGFS